MTTWMPLPNEPSPYLQKSNLASFILEVRSAETSLSTVTSKADKVCISYEACCGAQEIVALKPYSLNRNDQEGDFYIGVIVWDGNIKPGYEGLFDQGECPACVATHSPP